MVSRTADKGWFSCLELTTPTVTKIGTGPRKLLFTRARRDFHVRRGTRPVLYEALLTDFRRLANRDHCRAVSDGRFVL